MLNEYEIITFSCTLDHCSWKIDEVILPEEASYLEEFPANFGGEISDECKRFIMYLLIVAFSLKVHIFIIILNPPSLNSIFFVFNHSHSITIIISNTSMTSQKSTQSKHTVKKSVITSKSYLTDGPDNLPFKSSTTRPLKSIENTKLCRRKSIVTAFPLQRTIT